MREIKIYAPAKLNLYLDVFEKRADGFHNIETLFEKIDLKDELIIKEKGKGVSVNTSLSACPSGEGNIVYKAVRALLSAAKVDVNLDIQIKKNIPLSGGLGGGSSDAASALKAINKMFNLGVPAAKLLSIACDVGKDMPFFMIDAPFAVARGTGELLEPLDIPCSLSHIIIKPRISMSTDLMYQRIDGLGQHQQKKASVKDMVDGLRKKDISLVEKNYYNIFEEVLAEHFSPIKTIKDMLIGLGAGNCLLSGSGSSVFCTFGCRKEGIKVFKKIPKIDAEVFFAETCSLKEALWK